MQISGNMENNLHEWFRDAFAKSNCKKISVHLASIFIMVKISLIITSPKESIHVTEILVQFSSVQSLSCVWLFATQWIAARQASLSLSNSQSSLTHVYRVSDAIQPSHPLSSPSPPAPNPSQHQESFPMSQLFAWGNQSTGVSALASFPPKKSQGWSPSEWTGWISLQS